MASLNVLTKAHAYDLSVLHQQCFTKPWSASFFETLLSNKTTLAYGHHHNSLLSCILVHNLEDSMDILTLCTHPLHRRLSYGRQLLEAIMERAKQNGCQKIFLDVKNNNLSSLSLYKAFGFKIVSIRKNYYTEISGKTIDALVMCLSIHEN